MQKLTLRDVDVSDKKVLVRVDFNVPLDEHSGAITDDSRIRAVLPTMEYLTQKGARMIFCSHLGRPKGKVVEKLRLAGVARLLSRITGRRVEYATECIGPEVEAAVDKINPGDILLLENVRFHPEEESNDDSFARALARLAEVYVNDAFGAAHRCHASVVGIASHLPAVAGLLLEKELNNLGCLLEDPPRPFRVLLGGSKLSDKLAVIENIMGRVEMILIGGGMAATFLKAKSCEVGRSLVNEDMLDLTTRLMIRAESNDTRIILPTDFIVTEEITRDAKGKITSAEDIPPDMRIVDIGPETIEKYTALLKKSRTVFWNGPMGIYEIPQFAMGTLSMSSVIASLDATTIIGGGSTAEIVVKSGLAEKMTFVSTGGGASLKFLSGKALPGVEALMDKKN